MTRRAVLIVSIAALVGLGNASAASAMLRFNSDWGGVGVIAGGHSENLCAENRVEPGSHREALVLLRGGDAVGHGPQALYGTLLCAPQLDVWPNSTGPWEGGNWISLPCPAEEKPIDGGAGYWIGSRHSTSSFSQAGGGFGHHNNGYWHYRFHNHYRFTLSVQFWAVCVSRRATTV